MTSPSSGRSRVTIHPPLVLHRLLSEQRSADQRLHPRYDIITTPDPQGQGQQVDRWMSGTRWRPLEAAVNHIDPSITSITPSINLHVLLHSDLLVGVPNDRNTAGTVRVLNWSHWSHWVIGFTGLLVWWWRISQQSLFVCVQVRVYDGRTWGTLRVVHTFLGSQVRTR